MKVDPDRERERRERLQRQDRPARRIFSDLFRRPEETATPAAPEGPDAPAPKAEIAPGRPTDEAESAAPPPDGEGEGTARAASGARSPAALAFQRMATEWTAQGRRQPSLEEFYEAHPEFRPRTGTLSEVPPARTALETPAPAYRPPAATEIPPARPDAAVIEAARPPAATETRRWSGAGSVAAREDPPARPARRADTGRAPVRSRASLITAEIKVRERTFVRAGFLVLPEHVRRIKREMALGSETDSEVVRRKLDEYLTAIGATNNADVLSEGSVRTPAPRDRVGRAVKRTYDISEQQHQILRLLKLVHGVDRSELLRLALEI